MLCGAYQFIPQELAVDRQEESLGTLLNDFCVLSS